MNKIQLEIFRVFLNICEELDLKYFLVHGSLLGAIIYKGFFPLDDDIDIAMPRKDYNTFITEGPHIAPEGFFIQSYKTDEEFPLVFGKMRMENTTFIQPLFSKLHINMGIYIDVFPMDYYPNSRIKQGWLNFKYNIYSARISNRFYYTEKQILWKRIIKALSIIICPSWERAKQKRAELYMNVKKGEEIIINGGKPCEKGIPVKWFSSIRKGLFEGEQVYYPCEVEEYLKHIYGDYKHFNPMQEYLSNNGYLSVSASIFDPEKSYTFYLNNEGNI